MGGSSLDLNLGPDWEVNVGLVCGLTRATDRLIAKLILGRRFGGGGASPSGGRLAPPP